MKNLFYAFIFLISIFGLAQQDDWKEQYSTEWSNYDEGTKLIMTNNNYLPVSYKIDFYPVNLKQSIPNGTIVVIPGRTKGFVVIDFKIIEKGKGWKFKKGNSRIYLGDLIDVEYDRDFIYDLPFEKGTEFKVGQGYNGKISHQGKNQLDFNMPIGTKIYASRAGLVVEVVKKNSKSCGDPKCIKYNNLVKILHNDGTIMKYLHFRKNGVRVRTGETVEKGQHIGFSGNVGYSTGPHLHMSLYLIGQDNNYNYLATKFKINDGDVIDQLIENEIYLKNY